MHSIRSYAKINLGLFVHDRRPDGYHNISTVFHRIGLYDKIELHPSTTVLIETDGANVPTDHTNICHRAAVLLQKRLETTKGVRIVIRKRIPVGAGLGGGSTNAASVLLHLPQLWETTVTPGNLQELALQLGSDVPYFLQDGSAVGTGRGETLEYFPLSLPWHIVLCNPHIHVSTAWAYGQIHARSEDILPDLKDLILKGLQDPRTLRENLRNDFEEPVFARYPLIKNIKQQMLDGRALFTLMSGSGSSVFGFFEREDEVGEITRRLSSKRFFVHVTPPRFST